MSNEKNSKGQSKARFTRMCIGEAIVLLMQNTDYDHLKISDIVKRAGVSRMTFYRYYQNPKDALEDYLSLTVEDYLRIDVQAPLDVEWFDMRHILFSLRFFHRYRDYFLVMAKQNQHGTLLAAMNHLLEEQAERIRPDHMNRYQLYAYAGALLNTFIKWEEEGCQEPVEELAKILYEMHHGKVQRK